jgi:hypothetical protein
MKKKHYIKTIEDIKCCEENGIEVYDDYQSTVCFRFVDGVWCSYTNKNLNVYNVRLSLNSLYYEEESEEQQEATEKDIGKLCWFWNAYDAHDKIVGLLKGIEINGDRFYADNIAYYRHCRPLTKEEIKEFMENVK